MYQDERRLDFHALGREIKRKREAKGWTQEYLAQLVDRTPRSIMYFENRGQHPSLNTFYKIVTLLDISVDQFFYPDKQNEESDCRQHIDRMLNTMDENELRSWKPPQREYKKPEKRRERKKRRCLRFFVGFPGYALTASRASVATLAIFASRRAAKVLVGEPPQTRHFGTKCPKVIVCVTVAYRSCSFLRWPSVTPSR